MSELICDPSFFRRDALEVAPELPGKLLSMSRREGGTVTLRISEVEVYRGAEDTACHVHKGRTKRTELFFAPGGVLYVYLCYGIHWTLNIVTGEAEEPQAVLIRACEEAPGPGKLTKALGITGELNGYDLTSPTLLRLEDDGCRPPLRTAPRVGIGYASEEDQHRPWRFIMDK